VLVGGTYRRNLRDLKAPQLKQLTLGMHNRLKSLQSPEDQ
jgi:hypothetical protein